VAKTLLSGNISLFKLKELTEFFKLVS